MKVYPLVFLALTLATVASAARLAQDDGDYGDKPEFALPHTQCLDASGSPAAICAMTAEDWKDSVLGVEHVFDFLIVGDRSNFTLTLTGTEAFPADDPPRWSFGAFACNPFSFVQCGPDPTSQMAAGSPTLSLDGKIVTFDVTGANDPNHPFVFFAVEPDIEGSVTATLTANASATPEPGTFSLVFGAGLAVAALGRRRLAKLL